MGAVLSHRCWNDATSTQILDRIIVVQATGGLSLSMAATVSVHLDGVADVVRDQDPLLRAAIASFLSLVCRGWPLPDRHTVCRLAPPSAEL